MTAQILTSLAGGFLGSAHCVGMCGGFAATLGAAPRPTAPLVARQLVYSAGRISAYAFMGAMAGFLGIYLSQYSASLASVQRWFSIFAGVVMVIVGLSVLGLRLWPRRSGGGGLLAPIFAQCINAKSHGGYLLAGIANGFLPCGLVYAFLADAASSGAVSSGLLRMTAFGVGTMPAMLAIGCGVHVMSRPARIKMHRVAAVFVIVVGSVTIWRGLPAGAAHCAKHGPATAHEFDDSGAAATSDCCHESPATSNDAGGGAE